MKASSMPRPCSPRYSTSRAQGRWQPSSGARSSAAVNLAEIVSKLAERGLSDDHIHQLIDNLRLRVIPLSESQAFLAGQLRRTTRRFGLSLGDRVCLAVGLELDVQVVTAERRWLDLDLPISLLVIR